MLPTGVIRCLDQYHPRAWMAQVLECRWRRPRCRRFDHHLGYSLGSSPYLLGAAILPPSPACWSSCFNERPHPASKSLCLTPTPTPPPHLKVYVSGAVTQPGVFSFREGDRLQEAVHFAGGLLPDLDASTVNMAVLLEDEQHYHLTPPYENPRTIQTSLPPLPSASACLSMEALTSLEQFEP